MQDQQPPLDVLAWRVGKLDDDLGELRKNLELRDAAYALERRQLVSRVEAIENRPSPLVELRGKVRAGAVAAWPTVRAWLPWLLLFALLLRQQGCEVPDWLKPGPKVDPSPAKVAGLTTLIVYETGDSNKLTEKQYALIFGKRVRDYLDAHCVKGDDGVPAYRICDPDVPVENLPPAMQALMHRERKSLPWLEIASTKGGFEGPLPDVAEDEFIKLLAKYEG
jgi:hypothetical protein